MCGGKGREGKAYCFLATETLNGLPMRWNRNAPHSTEAPSPLPPFSNHYSFSYPSTIPTLETGGVLSIPSSEEALYLLLLVTGVDVPSFGVVRRSRSVNDVV